MRFEHQFRNMVVGKGVLCLRNSDAMYVYDHNLDLLYTYPQYVGLSCYACSLSHIIMMDPDDRYHSKQIVKTTTGEIIGKLSIGDKFFLQTRMSSDGTELTIATREKKAFTWNLCYDPRIVSLFGGIDVTDYRKFYEPNTLLQSVFERLKRS